MNRNLNSRYFTEDEVVCPCCQEHRMSKVLMAMLDQARGLAGVPFVLNSAWRCYKHNEFVGGSEESSHLFGMAVDIACTTSRNRFKILQALISAGFTRIGIHENFIHVDIDGTKDAEVMWMY